jgi:hypothetical protein
MHVQMIIPTFFMERAPMLRERASRFYAVLPWVQAMEDVEMPWVAAQVPLPNADHAVLVHARMEYHLLSP